MITFLEAKTIQQQLGKCGEWSTKYNICNPLIYTDHAALEG